MLRATRLGDLLEVAGMVRKDHSHFPTKTCVTSINLDFWDTREKVFFAVSSKYSSVMPRHMTSTWRMVSWSQKIGQGAKVYSTG